MRKLSFITLAGALTLALTLSTVVVADQVYHSERLPFSLVAGAPAGHPELRSGHVVNIHPNGPVKGALERYMINGAKPNTSYWVELLILQEDCDGDPISPDPLQTAELITNRQGNAQGQAEFSPEELAPFSEQNFGVMWTLVNDGGDIIYETACTVVSID